MIAAKSHDPKLFNLLRVESYKTGIFLSTFFNILNKGLVFCNGLLVAYFFGVHKSTDLFFYLYNTILIVGTFFTSMNSTVVIPESMRIRTQQGEEQGMRFLNFFVFLYSAIALTGLLLILLSPVGFFSVLSNFDKTTLTKYRYLLYLALPLFGLICIINLFIDILASHKFFTVPMIVGIINGSISILFVLMMHDNLDIRSVFLGLIISYSINLTLLVFMMKKYLGWSFLKIKPVREKRIWNNFGFAQLGNITSTLSMYTPMYILSGYNTGIITALSFAQQISSLPTNLVTYQFSTVAGIKFNELYAKKETGEINRVFSESANFLHFLLIPVSCFVFYYADDIVQFLLGFTSMNASASSYVALFLRFLGFLIPLYVVNSLIARLFMASHKIKQSFWYQVLFNVILITGLFYAVRFYGPVGYPLAMVSAYILNLGACYLIERQYFNFINYRYIMEQFGLFVIINVLISTSIFYLVKNFNIALPVLKLSVAFLLYAVVLLALNHILRMNNVLTTSWNDLLSRMKNKI